jgi:sigma-54-specific transcriptional regulator
MRILTLKNPDSNALIVRAKAVVFEDPLTCALLRDIRRIAPMDATALIVGETGTGKEIVARYIHELSLRADRPFVAVNCGAFSESLVDSELFGHEKGAFTGAITAKAGWFEAANGGTLFLDEVGELPLSIQVKLLRILQEREVVRLGSRQAKPIDVRLVAATNVNLEAAVRAGRFREDLFFRLNVMNLRLPALRERPGDILPLTEHFLRIYAERAGLHEVSLSAEAVQRILDHHWAGNIRELENVLQRATLMCQNGRIMAGDLFLDSSPTRDREEAPTPAQPLHGYPRLQPREPQKPGAPEPFSRELERILMGLFEQGGEDIYQRIDAAVVIAAYSYSHGNQLQAARLLGISRNILRAKLSALGFIQGRGGAPGGVEDPVGSAD